MLLGTCTRSFLNLGIDQLANTEGTQATVSVYEVNEIFGFGCGYIVQIRGSKDKDAFDGTQFTLRFPTIDDIADDIIACRDDPVLFKIDVTRAFRDL